MIDRTQLTEALGWVVVVLIIGAVIATGIVLGHLMVGALL